MPSCEFFGARFVKPTGWTVEEKREPGEPISRVALVGRVGTHQILLSIIPRELRSSAAADKKSQTEAYFHALRAALPSWTNVSESSSEAPARSYPVLFGTDFMRGIVTTQYDNTVLLYFPDDFPKGRYFYVFFWTDIHFDGERSESLGELRTVVDSFDIRTSPAGAPSPGCGS